MPGSFFSCCITATWKVWPSAIARTNKSSKTKSSEKFFWHISACQREFHLSTLGIKWSSTPWAWLRLNCFCQGHCGRSNTLANTGSSLAPCHAVSNTGWHSKPKVSIVIIFHFPSGRWRAEQLFASTLPLPHIRPIRQSLFVSGVVQIPNTFIRSPLVYLTEEIRTLFGLSATSIPPQPHFPTYYWNNVQVKVHHTDVAQETWRKL